MTWPDARVHCKNLNGDLASFKSEEEVGQLSVASSLWYWIGLKENEKGNWTWSDGSRFTWIDWAPGQPNKDNSCGVLMGKKLYDNPCTWTFYFICKTQGMC